MDFHTIYNHLWDSDDKFAADIAGDSTMLPSLRGIAFYILRNYANAQACYESCLELTPEDIFCAELNLMLEMLDYRNGRPLHMHRIQEVLSKRECSLYARILLAAHLMMQSECEKAIEQYQTVLSISPKNVLALDGLVKAYVCAKQNRNARSALKMIYEKRLLAGLEGYRKFYWQLTFLIYRVALTTKIRLFFALFVLIIGALLPYFWILPVSVVAALLSIGVFLRKNPWAFRILVRLSIGTIVCWFAGYLITFLESYKVVFQK